MARGAVAGSLASTARVTLRSNEARSMPGIVLPGPDPRQCLRCQAIRLRLDCYLVI